MKKLSISDKILNQSGKKLRWSYSDEFLLDEWLPVSNFSG